MLKNLNKWYQIINPNPSVDDISKFRQLTSEFMDFLTEENNLQYYLFVINAINIGFDFDYDLDSDIVKKTVEIWDKYYPTTSNKLSESKIKFQLTYMTAIGEIVTCFDKDKTEEHEIILLLAFAILSSNHLLHTNERIFHSIMTDLVELSQKTIQVIGKMIRMREELNNDYYSDYYQSEEESVKEITDEEIVEIKQKLKKAEYQIVIDREELEILWWTLSNYSELFGESFSKLSLTELILSCGIELAEKCLIPPAFNTEQLLEIKMANNYKFTPKSSQSLEKFADNLTLDLLNILLQGRSSIEEIVKNNASIFPLTWLFFKLKESRLTKGWDKEFGKKSNISTEMQLEPKTISIQLFRELILQKLALKMV